MIPFITGTIVNAVAAVALLGLIALAFEMGRADAGAARGRTVGVILTGGFNIGKHP
jgi:hypothetical protein